jgi:dihydroorotase-like cyclic amidohydrolase
MFLKTTDIGRLILEAVASNQSTFTKKASVKYAKEDAVKISNNLVKVASSPIDKSTFTSTQEMMKTASSCINYLVESLSESDNKIKELEKVASIRNILDSMIVSGLTDENDVSEKIAQLSKKSDRELEIVKEAVKLASGSKASNIFFDSFESNADSIEKRGIFDGVLGDNL